MSSKDTRGALILAGERLFGKNGIDNVSLRQINTAAGQRNASAAHYHFGSREALVTAVYEYRMASVNRRRLELLDRLQEDHAKIDIHAIVEAVVLPIVDEIRHSEGGTHYIRFLAQMIGHPQISLNDIWNSRFGEGLSRLVDLLRTALPDVPPLILGQRFGLMWEQTIHALADRERLREGGNPERMVDADLFVSNLIDTIAGGLAAPLSSRTLAALGEEESPRD